MLEELTRLHDELLEALVAMGQSLAGAAPKRAIVANARLKLTQVNGRRRRLLQECVFPSLEAEGDARALSVIRRLKAEEAEMMRRSSEHVALWTLEAICSDWEGYQGACARIRSNIRDRILLERALLCPLLGSVSSSAGSPSGRSMSPRPAPAAGTLLRQTG